MKKFFCIILCAILALSLSSCEKSDSSNDSYMDAYNDGYFEGRDWGQKQIAHNVEEEYSNIYSSELEKAVTLLEMYADGVFEDENGHPISEDELQEAVALLLEYKNNVDKIIYNIDEIEIY